MEALDATALLPPRRSAAAPATMGRVEVRDSLELGGGLLLVVVVDAQGLLVAPVVVGPDGVLRRARAGEGLFVRLLARLAAGGADGRFSFVPTERAGRLPTGARERSIDVDQSNESVVVGERVVVKLYPRTGGVATVDAGLPGRLSAAGFTSIPTPLGSVSWRDDDDRRWVLATASAYLPEARDGWDWYLHRLLTWLDGEGAPVSEDEIVSEPAAVLGALAAHMHAALASATELAPAPTATADAGVVGSWRAAAHAVADESLALTGGAEGARLVAREPAIRAELDRLAEIPAGAAGPVVMRIHGDFHVGQVLEWRDGFAITDFDGNPLSSPGEPGGELDTPVRDVAAFVRSIDHLGRIATRRRPGHDAATEAWIGASRAAFLRSYVRELDARGQRRLYDERLLRPLEIAQECHEYVYAARFLPSWTYVPDLAMQALIPLDV